MQLTTLGYVEPADTDNLARARRCYPRPGQRKPRPGGGFSGLWDGLAAGAVAGLLSGAPSTAHALLRGADPLAAARAAGNLLLPADAPSGALLVAGGLAHGALSLGWGVVLAAAVRRSPAPPVVTGLVAGAAIAALDLGLLGRRWPLIRALPVGPQVADHLAFGAVTGAVLARRVEHRP